MDFIVGAIDTNTGLAVVTANFNKLLDPALRPAGPNPGVFVHHALTNTNRRSTKCAHIQLRPRLAMKGDRARLLAEGFDGYPEKPQRYRAFLASVAVRLAEKRVGYCTGR